MEFTTQPRETRVISTTLEIRSSSPNEPSRTIRGYAAKFSTDSQPLAGGKYSFIETIAPGAFEGTSFADVRALFNHDRNIVLGRSKNGAGTLQLGVDETGLWYEFDAPNTTAGNDLLELVSRGDIDQSSFAFTIADGGEQWIELASGEADNKIAYQRTITKIAAVFDVSPVTEPAYQDTTVALRSLEKITKPAEDEVPAAPAVDPSLAHRQRALSLRK